MEETQKVNANNNDEEILAEDRSIEEPDHVSSVVMTVTTTVRKEVRLHLISFLPRYSLYSFTENITSFHILLQQDIKSNLKITKDKELQD